MKRILAITIIAALSLAWNSAMAFVQAIGTAQTTAFTVSNTDLLQTSITGSPTSVGNFTQEGSGGVPVLNDGLFGALVPTPPGPANNSGAATGGNGGGTLLTYQFNTTLKPLGYQIDSINTYVGWGDAGRNDQAYTVSYSTVFNPGTFTNIGSPVSFASGVGNPSATREIVNDTLSIPLANNAAFIRFTFNNVENGYTGYRELDVFGRASPVPEPSTLMLLGLGLSGLYAASRKLKMS